MNFLEPYLGNVWYAVALSVMIVLVAAFVAGRILKFALHMLESRVAKKTKTRLDNLLLQTLEKNTIALVVLFTVYVILKQLGHIYAGFSPLWDSVIPWAVAISFIINALFLAFVGVQFIRAVVSWYMEAVAKKTESRLDDELAPLIKRVLNFLIFLLAIVVILDHFQQDLSTVIVSLGVGSLAIALAAQDTLANMIAGFVLMIDRPFRIGDRVELVDGKLGNVKDIGIRTTKLVDDREVMILIPNAEIIKSQIQNLSYPNEIVRFPVEFGVAYGTDTEHMRRLVIEAVNAEPDIVDRETTEIRILEMGDSSVNAKLLCKIDNPNHIPKRKADLVELIYKTLNANKIEIPFPQRVVHFGPSAINAIKYSTTPPGGKGQGEGSD